MNKHNLIHEQLHARSVSHEKNGVYAKNRAWEEIPVEFFAREICKKEKIAITQSDYYNSIENLKEINSRIKISQDDYTFAKLLFEQRPQYRKEWLRKYIVDAGKDFKEIGELERLLEGVMFLGQNR